MTRPEQAANAPQRRVEVPSASQRVAWLLAICGGSDTPAATSRSPFGELALVLADRHPEGSPGFWRGILRGAWDPDQPIPIGLDALEAITEVLGAPRTLLDDNASVAAEASRQVAGDVLARAGVRQYWTCRISRLPADWRLCADPDEALPFLRAGEAVSPPAPVGVSVRSCNDPSERGACRGDSGELHPGTARRKQGERPVAAEPLTEEQLRTTCRELVTDLGLTPPLDPRELCRAWSVRRGRRVTVTGAELGATNSVGHLVVLGDRDRIFFELSAPSHQQAHVIYHEVVHLLRGHLDGADQLTCGSAADHAPRSDGLYARWQEWEAEVGATFLSALSQERRRPGSFGGDDAADAQPLAGAFGLSQGGLL